MVSSLCGRVWARRAARFAFIILIVSGLPEVSFGDPSYLHTAPGIRVASNGNGRGVNDDEPPSNQGTGRVPINEEQPPVLVVPTRYVAGTPFDPGAFQTLIREAKTPSDVMRIRQELLTVFGDLPTSALEELNRRESETRKLVAGVPEQFVRQQPDPVEKLKRTDKPTEVEKEEKGAAPVLPSILPKDNKVVKERADETKPEGVSPKAGEPVVPNPPKVELMSGKPSLPEGDKTLGDGVGSAPTFTPAPTQRVRRFLDDSKKKADLGDKFDQTFDKVDSRPPPTTAGKGRGVTGGGGEDFEGDEAGHGGAPVPETTVVRKPAQIRADTLASKKGEPAPLGDGFRFFDEKRTEAIAAAEAALSDPTISTAELQAKLDRLLNYAEAEARENRREPGTLERLINVSPPAVYITNRIEVPPSNGGRAAAPAQPAKIDAEGLLAKIGDADPEKAKNDRRPSSIMPVLLPSDDTKPTTKIVVLPAKRKTAFDGEPAAAPEGSDGTAASGKAPSKVSSTLIDSLRLAIAARQHLARPSLATSIREGVPRIARGMRGAVSKASRSLASVVAPIPASFAGEEAPAGATLAGLGSLLVLGAASWASSRRRRR